MYRNNKPIQEYITQFTLNGGGLGDCIARTVPVAYVLNYHKEVKARFFVPDFFKPIAVRCLPKVSKEQLRVHPFSERHRFKQTDPTRVSESNAHTNLSYHMTDHAFNLMVNKQVKDHHKDYLPIDVSDIDISRFNLPENYVVVTTGYTSPVREFLPSTINEIIDYLVSKNITPVFLGKTATNNGYNYTIKGNFDQQINYHKGINLIDKTDILETTKILYGAKTSLGVDNGLLHLAATHPTNPVIWGFSTVNPCHRVPYRGGGIMGFNSFCVVPDVSLDCRFCQSNMVYQYTHPSFTECVYKVGARGKDIACLPQLTSQKYIDFLERILFTNWTWTPQDLGAELP